MGIEYALPGELKNKIRKILNELIEADTELKALLLAYMDGTPIASTLSSSTEMSVLAAILATLAALNRKIINYLPLKDFKYSTSKFEEGGIFITPIAQKYFLLVYFSKNAKLGIVLRDIELLKKKLSEIL